MKKYYKLDENSRIGLTADIKPGVPAEEEIFDFPDGFDFYKQGDYKIIDDELVYDPIPEDETPTQLDIIEAQVAYTAMMTDTFLGV